MTRLERERDYGYGHGEIQTSKHTKGPWTVDYSGPARLAITDKDERIIAFGDLQNENGDEDEANAALIAAAPELLEACKAALKVLEQEPANAIYKAHTQIVRNAICKAEGGDL